METFDSGISITLEDKLTGQMIDLRANPVYTFAHSTSDYANRFKLYFGSTTTSVNENAKDFSMYASYDQIAISIPALNGMMARIEIMDMAGRLLYSNETMMGNLALIPQPDIQGIVLVRVSGSTGVYTSRIMIQK